MSKRIPGKGPFVFEGPVRLASFSGTGGTALAADTIARELSDAGIAVLREPIRQDKAAPVGDFHFLAVH